VNPRHHRGLRGLARKLPVLKHYERRLTELHGQLAAEREANRLFAPPGHFYSPFADEAELTANETALFLHHPLDVPAVELQVDQQWALHEALAPHLRAVRFARTEADARERGLRYWAENFAFGDVDGATLVAMLAHFRPQRWLELGCGFSSACLLDARDVDGAPRPDVTFVDPYPALLDSLVTDHDREHVVVRTARTQDLDVAAIGELQRGDVLFVDSTHVAKPGSDVNHLFFHILPALQAGVIVHLHDIFPRFEYPKPWILERRGWTEQYVLRAFLQFNDAFRILYWPTLLNEIDQERAWAPYPTTTIFGGSIWLQKVR